MDLTVAYKKTKSKDEAYKKVKSNIGPKLLDRFNIEADINYNDKTKEMEAEGTGFTMKFVFKKEEVQVFLKLSFLLRAIKGKVLSIVEKELKVVV